MKKSLTIWLMLTAGLLLSGAAQANWSETFGGNAFDLTTWLFRGYPELTGTFKATIQDGPDDDDYLTLDETSPADVGGTQIGVGIGDPDDIFTDVRVGAVVNVTGDASRTYHGLAARISYVIDDGTISGYPGILASSYLMMVHYQNGLANLEIELMKTVYNDDAIMATYQPEVPVPGLDHAKSHYIELDVVGSDPVYITGSIYEYKGGPLLVRTPTFIDTSANDPWEAPGIHDDVFASGVSGIFGTNQELGTAGYHSPFDSVSSVSDGPAAVNPTPVDGAADLSVDVDLSWVEAAFATSRELWLGTEGAMQKFTPAGTTFDPGPLEFGQTYQWRVDEIGPAGTVTGHTWSFTTRDYLIVDDIEDYTDNKPNRVFDAWLDGYTVAENGSIVGYYPDAPFVETEIVHSGAASMPFTYNNADVVNYAEAVADTANLKAGQDWTRDGVKALTLHFRGRIENTEEIMYVRLEDAAAKTHTVTNPYPHAVQSESWRAWDIDLGQFSAEGLDLSNVKKICIGFGDKTGAVTCDGSGIVFFDDIRLYPARCFNAAQLDLSGDVNGDCVVDFQDFALMADGWLNEGLSVVP